VGRLTGPVGPRVPIEVPVGPLEGTGRAPAVLRGWVRSGTVRAGVTPVLYCVAGGGCSTGYFDLEVGGRPGYSMAEHAAAAGAVVVALDHLGVGASDTVDDLYAVTPTGLASCHHRATSEVVRRLRAGELGDGLPAIEHPLVVGLGHSMGGMLAAVQQARHRSFDALVLLGTGGDGLPEVLTDDERSVAGPDLRSIEAEIVRLARLRFAAGSTVERRRPSLGTFFTDDVPREVRVAFAAQAVPLLPVCALTSMIPCSAHAERAGHCHHQAAGRRVLWDRILAWVDALAVAARRWS